MIISNKIWKYIPINVNYWQYLALWQILTITDNIRQYLTISSNSRKYKYLRYLTIPTDILICLSNQSDIFWWYIKIIYNIWQFLTILDNIWQYFKISVNIRKFLTITINIWQYWKITDNICHYLIISYSIWHSGKYPTISDGRWQCITSYVII